MADKCAEKNVAVVQQLTKGFEETVRAGLAFKLLYHGRNEIVADVVPSEEILAEFGIGQWLMWSSRISECNRKIAETTKSFFLEAFENEALSTAKKIAEVKPFNVARDMSQTIYGHLQSCKSSSWEAIVLSEIWYLSTAGEDVPRSTLSDEMLPRWPYPIMGDMTAIEQVWLLDKLPSILRMTDEDVKATTACLKEMQLLISIPDKSHVDVDHASDTGDTTLDYPRHVLLTPVGRKLVELLNPEQKTELVLRK
jgi:hypothetical protein